MHTRVIAEIGSTHLNDLLLIREGCEALAEADVDAVKFQLFPDEEKYTKSGNIYLSPAMFFESAKIARECGLDVSASVFDEDCLDVLMEIDPNWIKFAYSRKEDTVGILSALSTGKEAIVSCDVMTIDQIPSRATRLFCLPVYPVCYQIRFDHLFPRFDGFSDHSLGFDQTLEAVASGAKTIEKHVKFAEKGCPDCAFALSLKSFQAMTSAIRRYDREGAE